MKPAAWPYRLWGVRHIRALILTYRINQHYEAYSQLGMLPVNADKDFAIVDRIRRGEL